MDEYAWLFRFIPEGASVSAVLAVVIAFLKHVAQANKDHRETIADLTKQFTEQLIDARVAFGRELKDIGAVFSKRHEAIEARVQTLHDGHMETQTETIVVLTSLKEAIQRIEEKVK